MIKVVQCWDDGVNDDIRLIEILRKHEAKASFNLNPATHKEVRQGGFNERWNKTIQRLAQSELNSVYEGFSIANHSMTHPRPTQIPLEQWRSEVVDARKVLQDWFQDPIYGFVYPFGGHDEATAEVVREAGHSYARTTKNVTPSYPPQDPMMLHPDCHFHNESFWDLYASAKQSDCGVFYFWGHSYELCTEEQWTAFDEKIAKISADPEATWVELTSLYPST